MLVQIPEHPDYFVNHKGEVYSMRPDRHGNRGWRKLSPALGHNGYLSLHLGRKVTAYVHALVALAWIGPRPRGYQINHIDGNKLNNTPENIEYATPSENLKHAHRTGLKKTTKLYGEDAGQSKLTNKQRAELITLKGTMLQREAGELYGLSQAAVSRIWGADQYPQYGKRLSQEEIKQITELKGTAAYQEVMEKFNISHATVWRIWTKKETIND